MAITNRMWIKLPATWKLQPNSQRINRIAKIVQSISVHLGQRGAGLFMGSNSQPESCLAANFAAGLSVLLLGNHADLYEPAIDQLRPICNW